MNSFQSEQKRFLQQHKQRSETYSKAAATIKKQRKKNKGTTKTGLAMDKELKVSSTACHISREVHFTCLPTLCCAMVNSLTLSNQLILVHLSFHPYLFPVSFPLPLHSSFLFSCIRFVCFVLSFALILYFFLSFLIFSVDISSSLFN